MMDIAQDILLILENWLNDLNQESLRLNRLQDLKFQLVDIVQRIEVEDQCSIIELGQLEYVNNLWLDLINILMIPITDIDERKFITIIFKIQKAGQIPLNM